MKHVNTIIRYDIFKQIKDIVYIIELNGVNHGVVSTSPSRAIKTLLEELDV